VTAAFDIQVLLDHATFQLDQRPFKTFLESINKPAVRTVALAVDSMWEGRRVGRGIL
jgi:uncharacterized protein (DUF1778 family)